MNNSGGTGSAPTVGGPIPVEKESKPVATNAWDFGAQIRKDQAPSPDSAPMPEQPTEVAPDSAESAVPNTTPEQTAPSAEAPLTQPAPEAPAPAPVEQPAPTMTQEVGGSFENNEDLKAIKAINIERGAEQLPSKYVSEAAHLINANKRNPHLMADLYNEIQKDVISKTGSVNPGSN